MDTIFYSFCLDNTFRIQTSDEHGTFPNSLATMTSKPFFVFGVSACQEVFVNLLGTAGWESSKVFVVELGADDNTLVLLHEVLEDGSQNQVAEGKVDAGVLTCDALTRFWIAVEQIEPERQKLEAGLGKTPYQQSILSYTSNHIRRIRAISLSSSESAGDNADWEFRRDAGTSMSLGLFSSQDL